MLALKLWRKKIPCVSLCMGIVFFLGSTSLAHSGPKPRKPSGHKPTTVLPQPSSTSNGGASKGGQATPRYQTLPLKPGARYDQAPKTAPQYQTLRLKPETRYDQAPQGGQAAPRYQTLPLKPTTAYDQVLPGGQAASRLPPPPAMQIFQGTSNPSDAK